MAGGWTIWRYRRRFRIGARGYCVTMRARSDGLWSELREDEGDSVLATDHTPISGPDAVRNHRLAAPLAGGRLLEVDAGYISALNTGIAVFLDGTPIHQSHPGRTIAYPEKYREAAMSMKGGSIGETIRSEWNSEMEKSRAEDDGLDYGAYKRNAIPLSVDIALGLLFFVIAKLTDLTTAAIVGAAIGLLLLVIQRLSKIDLLGGLALFGIAIMLLSATIAWLFQSDDAIKYRTTGIGLFSASLFLADGIAGGGRLAKRLALYLPYKDIDPARLGIGMGLLGIVMAGLNYAVATLFSTDTWLFYTTFVDFFLGMALILLVFRYARGEMLRDLAPHYRKDRA